MAAPLKNIIVVSVTMKGGIRRRVTHIPLKAPTSPPTIKNAKMPAGTAMIGLAWASGPPSMVMTAAPTTLAIARTEAAERSIPATMSTKVWPMATTSSGMVAARMSRHVSKVRISGTIGATMIT